MPIRRVKKAVVARRKDLKIFNPVIEDVAIQMMNVLPTFEQSPQVLLHHVPVNCNVSLFDGAINLRISRSWRIIELLKPHNGLRAARFGAKLGVIALAFHTLYLKALAACEALLGEDGGAAALHRAESLRLVTGPNLENLSTSDTPFRQSLGRMKQPEAFIRAKTNFAPTYLRWLDLRDLPALFTLLRDSLAFCRSFSSLHESSKYALGTLYLQGSNVLFQGSLQ